MIVFKARRFLFGFTLVELLVVVAIISLLIAILLPSLSKARYEAKNVLCGANLKHVAIGVLSYTNDNAGYFPSSPSDENGYVIAPTVIALPSRGVDFRPGLKPYFGTFKGVWKCPMAPDAYRNGAVAYGQKGLNIDTSSVALTSYSHYFGRTAENGSQSNSDSYWGSGAAFFKLTQGMKRVNETQHFRCSNNQYNDRDFRLMSSDVMWYWWGMRWTHATPNALDNGTPGTYGEFASNDLRGEPTPYIDFNYSTDDGAVQCLRKVGFLDPRVTTTNDMFRGWVLPLY